MPAYNIKHITRYTYASEVIDCANQIMLYPIEDERLEVLRHELTVVHDSGERQPTAIGTYTDCFGNTVGVFTVLQPHTVLVIESEKQVVTRPVALPPDDVPAEQQWKHLRTLATNPAFIDFMAPEDFPSAQEVQNTLSPLVSFASTPLQNAQALSAYVYNNFLYQKGITNVETPAEEIWRLKAGVCQDFAHILLAMLRLFGIPARYVSGYVCPRDETVRGTGATHAWVEAYIPFYGWLGLDPTNNCLVSDGHVRIALGRSFADCTPVKGTYKGSGSHKLSVAVHIESSQPEQAKQALALPLAPQEARDADAPVNSYRHHLEQQQQQQQQQQ
ncbi:transglutaminase family protein [Hymenobacter latericus]|uniref:transglutaminase family protein n=1 Tax=Hymenobacter sp. YIM 151858-1 TaxID=2987688 RepID=UPI002226FBD9|nr:transglutaminase family protein [Hymenobacter sp. YIM 151858-1]UYZ59675.1 transglutaminase family protein [Hymenobacter sp. YIM 151858-1]